MGEAKRRGSFEQRKAKAIAKAEEVAKQQAERWAAEGSAERQNEPPYARANRLNKRAFAAAVLAMAASANIGVLK